MVLGWFYLLWHQPFHLDRNAVQGTGQRGLSAALDRLWVNALIAYWLFGESLTVQKIVGIGFIVIGVVLLSWNFSK